MNDIHKKLKYKLYSVWSRNLREKSMPDSSVFFSFIAKNLTNYRRYTLSKMWTESPTTLWSKKHCGKVIGRKDDIKFLINYIFIFLQRIINFSSASNWETRDTLLSEFTADGDADFRLNHWCYYADENVGPSMQLYPC